MQKNKTVSSSKVSVEFIELHDFKFRHGTNGIPNLKFIGRIQIKNRLKTILSYGNNNSGAYLITGNRGVGKTTLVNQVLEELSPHKFPGPTVLKFINVIVGVFVFNLFTDVLLGIGFWRNARPESIIPITIPVFLFCSAYTVFLSRRRKQLPTTVSLYDIYSLCRRYHKSVWRSIWIVLYSCKRHYFPIILHYLNCWAKEMFTSNFTLTTPSRHFNTVKYVGTILGIESLAILLGMSPITLSLCYGSILWWTAKSKSINRQLCNPMTKVHRDYKELLERTYNRIYNKNKGFKFLDKTRFSYIVSCTICFFSNTILLAIISLYLILFKVHPILIELIIFNAGIAFIYCIGIPISIWLIRRKEGNDEHNYMQLCRMYMQLCRKAWSIYKDEKKYSLFFKRLLNSHQQLFVKINLGYNELKTVDVLRLISHNITIEYRRFIYSGIFFWIRKIILVTVCCLLSAYMYSFPELNNKLWQTKCVRFLTDSSISNWFECLYEKFLLILNFAVASFLHTLRLAPCGWLDTDNIIQLEYINISLLQFLIFIFILFAYRISVHCIILKTLDTPYRNLKRLEELQDSIAASIKREEGMTAESVAGNTRIGISKRTEKDYPMSDAHDIEKKLIDILAQISNGWMFRKPQVIIIFDELDKLEDSSDKQENIVKTDSFSPDTVRRRQEAIYKLLSGLKYILTTMQAKFIFVAGRELYEASLADASDRNHYLSSIFNDVIIVPSFMADGSDHKNHDIFSMTEQYVCRHLIPTGLWQTDYSLEKYKTYMEEYDHRFLPKTDEQKRAWERRQILLTLHNFIVYLTYASKGAPKKMISLFEKHVERLDPTAYKRTIAEYNETNEPPICVNFYANSNYYLRFDFYDQYLFGLMKRIVSPMAYRFNRTRKHKFGDKALVSSLFFLDHMYKFHRNSFSWRALECTPELIDINKIPELRDHVTDILHFMSQNDLKNISNGLYDFRFFKKIAQEVCFVTRISEQASAIFNFTLDESYSVKQYYQRKLVKMREQYSADRIKAESATEELASLHFTLGELQLYDEEISEAIIEFDAAISILYTIEPHEMSSEQIVILMKSMMSLGIAYEKQNQNDRAMLIYIEAVRLLIASKNTDISEFGLQTEEESKSRKMVVKTLAHHHCFSKEPYIYFKDISGSRKGTLINTLDGTPHLHPAIQNFLSKITAFESLTILYLPILAKIQILEKSQIGGIQPKDIRRSIKEFYYLANMMNKENKYTFCANFYLKIGDILFYKNSSHIPTKANFYSLFPFPELFPLLPCEGKTIQNENTDTSQQTCPFKRYKQCDKCGTDSSACLLHDSVGSKMPDALYFYLHSLRLVLKDAGDDALSEQDGERNKCNHCLTFERIIQLLKEQHKDNYKGWDESRFHLLATILTNIGDVLFSTLKDNTAGASKYAVFFESYINAREKDKDILESLSISINKVQNEPARITFLYLLAYLYFKKATAYNMASFQCQRILSFIKYIPESNSPKGNGNKEKFEKIAQYFFKKALSNTRKSFKEMYFENLVDTQYLHNEKGQYPQGSVILYSEALEILLAYQGIRLRNIASLSEMQRFFRFFDHLKYDEVNSILNRIKLLNFKSDADYQYLLIIASQTSGLRRRNLTFLGYDYDETCQQIINMSDSKVLGEKNLQLIKELINDAIFNLHEIINFTKMYGENYVLTNHFAGNVYHKYSIWLRLEEHFFKNEKNEALARLIGSAYTTVELRKIGLSNTQRYYHKAKEMHTEGRTYKDMVNRACFLNDEFSDQRFHFIAAKERWIVQSEKYKELLKTEAFGPIEEENLYEGIFDQD